jgi:hypothetical protein
VTDRIGVGALERIGELSDGPTVRTFAEYLANPALLAPPIAVIPRLAYRGRLTQVAAPKKTGKSTLLGAAVAAVTQGHPFLGEPTTAASVLWACLDEPEADLVRRLYAERAHPTRTMILGYGARLGDVLRFATDYHPDLLVVDTISDALLGMIESENDNAGVKTVLDMVRQFARKHDIAVLWAHHTGKVSGTSRGASAFEEVADLLVTIKRDSEDAAIRRVEVEGRVGVEPFAYYLTPSGVELADKDPTTMALVEMAVFGNPGCSTNAVVKKVSRRRADVLGALGILQRLGRIENTSGTTSGTSWEIAQAGTAFPPLGTTPEPLGENPGNPHGNSPEPLGNQPRNSTNTPLSFRKGVVGTTDRNHEETPIEEAA